MDSRSQKQGSECIVYDADRIQHPDGFLFDVAYWRERGAVSGEAVGRGSAFFIEAPFGNVVLRKYLRGGLPGRFIRDHYVFTGWQRSRPVSEFDVLERLHEAGLPVPRPVAAMVRRHGLVYTGALMTLRIDDVSPLADELEARAGDAPFWRSVGRCIRRFHDHGVVHADLNARNILVGGERIYLIDFDRARIAPGRHSAFRRNLARLRRSLEKFRPPSKDPALEGDWKALLGGYAGDDGRA